MELRSCLGTFVTGVTVITTIDDRGNWYGLTANSFSSVSLDPPLILWSLRRQSSNYPVYIEAERFAVNILAEDQVDISRRFASSREKRFEDIQTEDGLGGVPLIANCAATIECVKRHVYPGGDHAMLLGEVERIHRSSRSPLAFKGGKYATVDPYELSASAGLGEDGLVHSESLRIARAVVDGLARKSGKSVGLAVWGNEGPTMIWWAEGALPLKVNLRAGLVMPLYQSASGRIFLAYSASSTTAELLKREFTALRMEPLGKDLVAQTIKETRIRGIAAVYGNILPGINDESINAFSVPVFDNQGRLAMALTMMGYANDLEESSVPVALLRGAGKELSQRFGYEFSRHEGDDE